MRQTILHTEASLGWGGQEMRIVKEAEGMRERGYTVLLAAPSNSKIFGKMKERNFEVFPLNFEKKYLIFANVKLLYICKAKKVDIINTHSSNDAWVAGIAGKLAGIPVIRTRHLSSPIRKGINSRVLYNFLADQVVTTCEEVVSLICEQAKLPITRCRCIPTGMEAISGDGVRFRQKYGIPEEALVVGTLCVLRSWKGVQDLIQAAHLLKEQKNVYWLIVGGGPVEDYRRREIKELGLENVIMTGHLEPPYDALQAMDIFALLSTANEGISQSSLQAAFLGKPLITTPTGGLKEVCLENKTGMLVPCRSPEKVAKAVEKLMDAEERKRLGRGAKELVLSKFTFQKTIEEMINVYEDL